MSKPTGRLPWTAFDEIEDGLVIYDADGLLVHLEKHYKMVVTAVNSHAAHAALLAAAKALLAATDKETWTGNHYVLKGAICAAEEPAP